MVLLQALSPDNNISMVLFFGTIGMLALTIGLIVFISFHQRKVIRYQQQLQRMEQDQQKTLLNASIRLPGRGTPAYRRRPARRRRVPCSPRPASTSMKIL